MPVLGRQTAAVVDDHQLAIPVLPTDKRDTSSGSGNHRSTPRSFDVLSGMELVSGAAEWIPPAANTAFERASHWPKRGRVAALAKDGFIRRHVLFQATHLRGESGQAHFVERQRWSAGSRQTGRFVNDA